jgi:hypothetical protein
LARDFEGGIEQAKARHCQGVGGQRRQSSASNACPRPGARPRLDRGKIFERL